MTRVSPEFGDEVQAVWTLSADVSFQSNQFPKYKLGPDNEILEEIKEDNKGPPLKEVVVRETNQLTEQHKRLSVRDLASKFDKNLAAAAKLSEEAKLKEVASLDGHVLLKKLRDALECLKGRLAGRNKEDVEKAISMASEDAKKLVNQEKSFACAEIESARAVVQRIGEALEEQERNQNPGMQQVVDMESELRELRLQIRESVQFHLTFKMRSMKAEDNMYRLYELSGSETLGSILRIQPCSDKAVELAKCSIQWYRLSSQCSRREAILGANKCVYAPEPIDIGRVLQADITSNGLKVTLTTDGPIEQASDLGSYLEALLRKPTNDFSLCGFRGGGNSAAKSLFWQARKGQSFVLVFESERERNGALTLARKYASDCNFMLAGPDDDALL
ncbi:UNVERIFIED_CONTAM: Stomatal closure-related actin-binding protein 2 [Sesamum calycinum]|uniref:Stomatal closure-related actin-binding protein 2 n=1 Tax=Sesamum calycinum TaxID=2727403 RepID=A0AAW2RUA3_9LAMI